MYDGLLYVVDEVPSCPAACMFACVSPGGYICHMKRIKLPHVVFDENKLCFHCDSTNTGCSQLVKMSTLPDFMIEKLNGDTNDQSQTYKNSE